MEFDIKMVISIGTVLFAGLSAWFAVQYGQKDNRKGLKSINDRVTKLEKDIDHRLDQATHTNSQQWQKLDEIGQRVASTEALTNRHEAVLDPAMIGDYREKRAKMEVHMDFLRRDVDILLGKE